MPMQDMRQEYTGGALRKSAMAADPMDQFGQWFDEAERTGEIHEPNAMTLCTVDAEGQPHGRIVLLKEVEADGFVFYTNYQSAKARQIDSAGRVALVFHWDRLERQVRIAGRIEAVSREQTEAYFAHRPRKSQLGAWASSQSEVVANREVIEQRFAELEKKYEGQAVPTPPYWGGYRVVPESIEFWQGQRSRLHDRLRYRREGDHGQGWVLERLSP